ncbi:MAG TPA: transglutaminase domain-containing protein, partial [Candidatus Hydrogenedentes bacterium]|nr:transglutaminase domain-containing protein [Candidatus Hydrogenedentota bacterium]
VVIATTVAGFTTLAWISEDEEVIRAETPIGLVVKKITPEEAFEPLQADESANMIRSLSITPTGATPNPDADMLRLRITSEDPALLPPEDARQRRDGNIFVITRQDPHDASRSEPLSDEESAACLTSDLFIQADHPRITETADDITDGAETSWDKAVRLYSWVYENIEKEFVLSVPSALDVLEQRKGDCNEHAVLFAALARAAGVPTRVVIGLAWSRKMQAFGYHAWVEVYAGQWIAMDPTFGEMTAGPTHIKLITGSIEQWPRLLSYIGALAIEVLTE